MRLRGTSSTTAAVAPEQQRNHRWFQFSSFYANAASSNNGNTTSTMEDINMNGSDEAPSLPTFGYSEITLGRCIGQGGFSDVHEILSFHLVDLYDTSEEEAQQRHDWLRGRPMDKKYVLKLLRSDLDDEERQKGLVDLKIEADFLPQFQKHPNIINMPARSHVQESTLFVILDRLPQTLEKRFNYWRKMVADNAGYGWIPGYGYCCCAKEHALHAVWKERLTVARDLASALRYLHEQCIVYRDLKPENVGFDAAGIVKIFDFGLAKRWNDPSVQQTEDGLYRLTGNTGSLRYMAPEVALNQPYKETVDAYSWAILFWQLCSLSTPFAGYNQKLHADRVIRQGHRPKADSTWPQSWVSLLMESWHADPMQRPAMQQIHDVMVEQVNCLADDYDGVVPTRAIEIRAARRKKRPAQNERLDVDTRLAANSDPSVKRFETDIV